MQIPNLKENELQVRQNQLNTAIEAFKVMQVKPTLKELLRLSQVLTDFVYDNNLNTYEIAKFEKHFQQSSNEKLLEAIPHHRSDSQNKKTEKLNVSGYQTQVAKELKGKN